MVARSTFFALRLLIHSVRVGLLFVGLAFPKRPMQSVRPSAIVSALWIARRARVSSMSAKPSLRCGGDVLSSRLAALRAVILARGVSRWFVHASGFRPIVCKREKDIPRAFSYLRSRGVSVCSVIHRKSACGCSVCVDKGTDWLLLSDPVLLTCEHVSSSHKPLGV